MEGEQDDWEWWGLYNSPGVRNGISKKNNYSLTCSLRISQIRMIR